MVKQTSKQFKLKSVDPISNKFIVDAIDVTLVSVGIKKGKVYDPFKGWFVTNKDVTRRDIKVENRKKNNF